MISGFLAEKENKSPTIAQQEPNNTCLGFNNSLYY